MGGLQQDYEKILIKKSIDYIFFSGLTAGIGFLTIIYMTRVITPVEFGVVGLYMAALYVLPQLISLATMGLVSINKVKLRGEAFVEFSKSFFTFGIFIFILIFSLSFLTGLFLEYYLIIFICVPIIAFIQYLNLFHNAELVQDGESRRYGSYRLILSLMYLLLTVLSISYFELSWDGRLYAILISELIILLVTLKFSFTTLKSFNFNYDIDNFREYIHFGIPLLLGLGAGLVLNQVDRIIILEFFTLRDVGIYTVAYSIGVVINIINQSVSNAIVPILYKSLEKKEGHEIVRKLNLYYSLTIMIIALLVGLSSFWYVPLFFGNEYSESPVIILFISLAFGFNGIYRTAGGVIAFYKMNKLQMKLLYAAAIINVIFSIILIPNFGILSPAIATIFAYAVLAYLSYHYGWKILKIEEKC